MKSTPRTRALRCASLWLSATLLGCRTDGSAPPAPPAEAAASAQVRVPMPITPPRSDSAPAPAHGHGLIPVFEYHVIRAGKTEFHHSPAALRADLETLYSHGYRPVTITEMNQRRIDALLPAGMKPFVAVFDDADPTQFRYVEAADGTLRIDPESAIGIWTAFTAAHPDWRNAATFCVLSAGDAGGAFFGNGNIQGQKTAWRFRKMQYLAREGFEICNHTVWHARLDRYSDTYVQEQIARLALAVDSAVPGYRIRTLALPLGIWPRDRALAWRGAWTDPRSGRVVRYTHDAVLEVSGGPNVDPFDPRYDPHSIDRIIAHGSAVQRTVERLDSHDSAYRVPDNAGATSADARQARPRFDASPAAP